MCEGAYQNNLRPQEFYRAETVSLMDPPLLTQLVNTVIVLDPLDSAMEAFHSELKALVPFHNHIPYK